MSKWHAQLAPVLNQLLSSASGQLLGVMESYASSHAFQRAQGAT